MSAWILSERAITATKDLDNHRSAKQKKKMSLGGIRSAGMKFKDDMYCGPG